MTWDNCVPGTITRTYLRSTLSIVAGLVVRHGVFHPRSLSCNHNGLTTLG